MPEDTIPLKRFFEAVEERLSACSADELRSILRAMAQVVAPKDRQGFLEALVPGKEARDGRSRGGAGGNSFDRMRMRLGSGSLPRLTP